MTQDELRQLVQSKLKGIDDVSSSLNIRRGELAAKAYESQDHYDWEEIQDIDRQLERLHETREQIMGNYSGYLDTPQEAEASESGTLDKIKNAALGLGQGVVDTAKFAVQHPLEAGKSINLGVENLLSLPWRAAESILPEGARITKHGMASREQDYNKALEGAGVDPTTTGPKVMRGVGEALVPAGPTLKTGELVKNILKGGAFTGGMVATENIANDKPILEDVPTAAAVGGGLSGVLGKLLGLTKGGTKPAAAEAPGPIEGEIVPPNYPRSGAPRQIESQTIIAGEGPEWSAPPKLLTHQEPIVTPPPPEALPGPADPMAGEPMFSGFKQLPKIVRTPDGLVATTKEGSVVSAPDQPTPLSERDPSLPERGGVQRLLDARRFERSKKGGMIGEPPPQVDPKFAREEVGVIPTKPVSAGPPKPKPEVVVPAKEESVTSTSSGDQSKIKALLGLDEPAITIPEVKVTAKAPEASAPVAAEAPAVEESPLKKLLGLASHEDAVKAKMAEGLSMNDAARAVAPKAEPKPKAKPKATPKPAPAAEAGESKIPTMDLADLLKGKKSIKDIPLKGKEKKINPSEAPAPTVEGEVGAQAQAKPSQVIDFFGEGQRPPTKSLSKSAQGSAKAAPKPREEDLTKSEKEMASWPPAKLEEQLAAKGWKVRERTDPIEGTTYDVLDEKGNLRARGDRAAILNAVQQTEAGKGAKLYSFPPGPEDIKEIFSNALKRVGSREPDVERVGPERSPAINAMFRNLENTRFGTRHSATMSEIGDEGIEATRRVDARYRDFYQAPGPTGERVETDYSFYQSLGTESKENVAKALLYGDRVEEVLTPEYLRANGLSEDEIRAYQGARKALDDAWKERKEEYLASLRDKKVKLTEDDLKRLEGIPGYIPHVWHGKWEIFVDGNKHLKPDQASGFETEAEALRAAYEIKSKNPSAKVSVRHFGDPTYSRRDTMAETRLLNTLRRRLESFGSFDEKAIDEAFSIKKDVKGFAKHLLERKHAEGFETQDLDRIIDGYLYGHARDMELKKFKRAAEGILERSKDLSDEQFKWITNHIERVMGKPAADDLMIQKYVGSTQLGKWLDPVNGGDALRGVRNVVNHLNLGLFNVGFAAINMTVVQAHVWPGLARLAKDLQLGGMGNAEKYLIEGVKGLFDRKLMKEMAHQGVVDIQLMAERVPDPRRANIKGVTFNDVSHFLGKLTEEWSRGIAGIASYKMALDAGLPKAEAIKLAHQFVGDMIGNYGVAAKPKAYSGAIGSTLGMYKTFMQVIVENALRTAATAHKDPSVALRYIMGTVGTAGLMGMPFADDIDALITDWNGYSPYQEMEKSLPTWLNRGLMAVLPGALGAPDLNVDLSRRAGAPNVVPHDFKALWGPVVNRLADSISALYRGDVDDAGWKLLPNSVRLAWEASGGETKDMRGRTNYRFKNDTEATMHAIGLPPVKESQASFQRQVMSRKQAFVGRERTRAMDKALDGDREALADYYKYGGSPRGLKKARKDRHMPARERQEKYLPKVLRGEFQ